MFKRVLITGANGLVGQKLTSIFAADHDFDLLVTARQPASRNTSAGAGYVPLDIADKRAVKDLVWNFSPDYILNAAAYTNVDGCETHKEDCWKANVTAVENLASACKLSESRLIHISTDYIFDGKAGPYDELATPNPISYYGKSKLAAENAVRLMGDNWAIVRTMVVFGKAEGVKANFALWLIGELVKGNPVKIVDDQFGNATLADDLARGIYQLVRKDRTGIYNMAGHDMLTRYEFALKVAKLFKCDPALITPVKTASFNQPAPRPLKSGLITLKAESELGIKFLTSDESIVRLKQQMENLN
jgi:dTDP-4-dehydrorhamnose reductase